MCGLFHNTCTYTILGPDSVSLNHVMAYHFQATFSFSLGGSLWGLNERRILGLNEFSILGLNEFSILGLNECDQ